jgi:hypothetical protein
LKSVATVISWGALFGAWLLFIGAIYQAALELRAHVIERDRIASIGSKIAIPPPVSPWWWLVPPWKYVLERRRATAYRNDYMQAMSVEDFTSLIAFHDKGLGWSSVALGAFLLAANQTFTFCGDRGWSHLVCGLSIGGLTIASVFLCIARLDGSDKLVRIKKSGAKF